MCLLSRIEGSHEEGSQYFVESWTVSQGTKSFTQIDPIYQSVSTNGCFQTLGKILKSCFKHLYLLLSANCTHAYLAQGHGRIYTTSLQLHIFLGWKSWLHGKYKINKVFVTLLSSKHKQTTGIHSGLAALNLNYSKVHY